MGYAYYDREILSMLAEQTDLNEDYLERTLEENTLTNLYPITIGQTFSIMPNYFADQSTALLTKQTNLIKALAAKSNCVIVGRNADIILRDQNPLRIFVHADMEARIARCRRRDTDDANLTDKQFEKKINQIDKNRSKTHSILSPYKWGDRRGYELCINTTAITIKDVVSSLSAYAEKWFEIERH